MELFRDILISIHVLGATIAVGAAITGHIVKFKAKEKAYEVMPIMSKTITLGMIILIITGVALFSAYRTQYLSNNLFIIKMILFVLSGIFAQAIATRAINKASAQDKVKAMEDNQKYFMISTILLVTVTVLGVLITLGN